MAPWKEPTYPVDHVEDPEPPANLPPRKESQGIGARVALNGLRALSPVAANLVRWSSGISVGATVPETPRGFKPVGSSSQPNLPSVARPPSTPAPSSARRPSGRRGSSTPREETQQESLNPESNLPTVQAPQSARSQTGSVKCSYQMTPREDSPVQKVRSKGRYSEVSQSAPAFSGSQRLGATGQMREMQEVQTHSQALLEAVFEMTITEEAGVSILDTYPELVWLANCLRRCPLPPGWTAMEARQGRLTYVEMQSGESQDITPLMPKFAEMGRLMLHWRQNPSTAADVAYQLQCKHDQDLEEAKRARKVWQGPHKDPNTGADFWHCPATGRSTWGDPGMAAEFLARIAERLQRALPVPSVPAVPSEEPTPGKLTQSRNRVSESQAKLARELQAGRASSSDSRPQTPLHQRQAEVRQMMAEIAGSSKAPSSKPERSRPKTPSRAALLEAEQDRLQGAQHPDAMEPSDLRRVCPGHGMEENFVETYTRPEFRRRRPESVDKLEKLDASRPATPAERPMTGRRPATAARPTTGARAGTGGRVIPPPVGSASEEAEEDDSRPRTRQPLGATQGLGTTGMVGQMCAGAIAAALQQACGLSPGRVADMEEFEAIGDDCDDDEDYRNAMAAALAAAAGTEDSCMLDDSQGPMSPSLMSICVARSPSPARVRKAALSPCAESPSIIMVDDECPLWTAHKPLPRPRTPPRVKISGMKTPRGERPILLGAPEPLSARARCSSNEAPLSARGPRPGNRVRRTAVGGA